jgi:hypothetical protein
MNGETVVESFVDGCRGTFVGGGIGGGEEGRSAAIVGHEAREARDRVCEMNVI